MTKVEKQTEISKDLSDNGKKKVEIIAKREPNATTRKMTDVYYIALAGPFPDFKSIIAYCNEHNLSLYGFKKLADAEGLEMEGGLK